MGSIKAIFPAVGDYARATRNEYRTMLHTADGILVCVEQRYAEVLEAYEKLSQQIMHLQMVCEEAKRKVRAYEAQMLSAEAEIERCKTEIEYLYAHPKTYTVTDDDGNETTETRVDEAAVEAAQQRKREAEALHRRLKEKHEAADIACRDAQGMLSEFEGIRRAIQIAGDVIQGDIYRVKKFTLLMNDEAEYNARALEGVLGSLSTYLASPAILLPQGARREKYASIASSSGCSVSSEVRDKSSEKKSLRALKRGAKPKGKMLKKARVHLRLKPTQAFWLTNVGRAVSSIALKFGIKTPLGLFVAVAEQAIGLPALMKNAVGEFMSAAKYAYENGGLKEFLHNQVKLYEERHPEKHFLKLEYKPYPCFYADEKNTFKMETPSYISKGIDTTFVIDIPSHTSETEEKGNE